MALIIHLIKSGNHTKRSVLHFADDVSAYAFF